MNIFTNPAEDQKKFLITFDVGADKIRLYGNPVTMSVYSELFKSLLDKIDSKETNVLAPNMKIDNPQMLNFLWEKMNGVDVDLPNNLKDLIDLWELMNYFDIDYTSKFVTEYMNAIHEYQNPYKLVKEGKFLEDNPGYSERLDNLSSKIHLIKEKREKKLITVYLSQPDSYLNYTFIDPYNLNKSLSGGAISPIKLVYDKRGNEYYKYVDIMSKNDYYTYPIWDKERDAYVQYQVDPKTVEINEYLI